MALRRMNEHPHDYGYLTTIDGFHGYEYDDGTYYLILDEERNVIPSSICLCAARAPSECMCGAWDDVIDDGSWN